MTLELDPPSSSTSQRSDLDRAISQLEEERHDCASTCDRTHVGLHELTLLPDVFSVRGERLNEYHLNLLGRALAQRGDLDPILVATIGARLVVVDGHHRFEAYRRSKAKRIPVVVFNGTVREAVLEANALNTKSILLITNGQRQDLAWRLVNANFTISQVTTSTGISRPQVGIMRRAKRALGDDAVDQKSWGAARRLADGRGLMEYSEEEAEARLEAYKQAVADKLRRALSGRMADKPEVFAGAIALFSGRRLGEVVGHLCGYLGEQELDELHGSEF
jgi:ParB-like chromosome segregation protein Spo0J